MLCGTVKQMVMGAVKVAVVETSYARLPMTNPPCTAPAEFGGIKVEIESPEIFRVALPDGRSAFVAPGETTPNRIKLHGIELEGTRMRYAQMTTDLDEVSGLGITHIAEVASFSSPAAFHLKRTSNGSIRVTTNTGTSLTDQWLHGQIQCIEAMTLDDQWVDVTAHCQNGSIPLQLVEEWSDRNQRTLVDFRINA